MSGRQSSNSPGPGRDQVRVLSSPPQMRDLQRGLAHGQSQQAGTGLACTCGDGPPTAPVCTSGNTTPDQDLHGPHTSSSPIQPPSLVPGGLCTGPTSPRPRPAPHTPSQQSGPAHMPPPASETVSASLLSVCPPPGDGSGARTPPAHRASLAKRGNVWCQEAGFPRQTAFSSRPPVPPTSAACPAGRSAVHAGQAVQQPWGTVLIPYKDTVCMSPAPKFHLPWALHAGRQARLPLPCRHQLQ